MAILDNRTLLTANDNTTGIVGLTGAAQGNQNTESFVEGSASTSLKISASVDGLLFDAGSAQDWSSNTFYIWWNVATAGKLDTKANGGVRVRFCGASASDFFEVNIEGSDTYTGGFNMTVIDIERAAASPDATGGTPPATTAIRYVGIVYDVTGMIGGNVDNCFLDAMWRLPANTPGILVEGQNTGPADWTWADIVAAADVGDPTKAWGTAFNRDGVIFINTPIRFGANDAVTHGFSDTNSKVQWEDQLVALTGFYVLEVVGGSGVQSFQLGAKSGTGDAAAGSQGGSIGAAAVGSRWSLDCDDANVDACNLYGVAFDHGEDFQLDSAAVEVVSCQFLDCTSVHVANSVLFQRCRIVDANTADGVAFLKTDDLTDVTFCDFLFSDGHAVELTTPLVSTQTSKGNTFPGSGADGTNDAAVYNNTGGAVAINVTEGGGSPTVRNGAGASTTVSNPVTHTVTGLGSGDRVVWIRQSDEAELENQQESGGSASYAYNYVSDTPVWVQILSVDRAIKVVDVTLKNTDQTLPASQEVDPFYSNPP